jgi:DNA-cytosine methyltransferase
MQAQQTRRRLLGQSWTRPKRWREILLVEDDSARAGRRPIAGVGSRARKSPVTIRLHRITAKAHEVIAKKTYRAGALRRRGKQGGRAAIALKLIDGIQPRRGTVIAAGPIYGCNGRFLLGLAQRDLDFVVEVRPSKRLQHTNDGPINRLRLAAQFFTEAKWKTFRLRVPGASTPLKYRVSTMMRVLLPGGYPAHLIAAQIGGIPGIHRGTILGVSSERCANEKDLLRVVGWTRWIRPATRRQERTSASALEARPKVRPKTNGGLKGAPLTVRANIALSRRQDTRAAWRQQDLPLHMAPQRGTLARSSSVLNVVELFAGAGGMGLGFLLAAVGERRYRIVFSGEVDPISVETLKRNHNIFASQRRGERESYVPNRVDPIDLRTSDGLSLAQRAIRGAGGVHVLVGGPPCQGFSNANRNSWHSANPHNRLVDVFLRYVESLRPAVFLLENVQGILWTPKGARLSSTLNVIDHLARRTASVGYEVFPKLLDAVWFGVPQYRSRLFLLGLRRDLEYRREDFGHWGPFPLPTHGPGTSRPYVTVEDAIRDLPAISNGENRSEREYNDPVSTELKSNVFLQLMRDGATRGVILDHVTSRHADYVIERYGRIPQGGNWETIVDRLTNYADVNRTHSNIYRRLKWREPSITIGHYRKSMLVHPSQHRGLSLREASRLQSLPDWFRFAGNTDGCTGGLVHKQQQLANAVCPLVTKALAEFILEL